jgi:hypothetical protein
MPSIILKSLKEKSLKFQPCSHSRDWPDALDHLAIGLVGNKYTKLRKTSENFIFSQGLSYIYKNSTVQY